MKLGKKCFCAVVLLVLSGAAAFGMGLKERQPSEINFSRLRDGIYQGESKHWPVAVNVDVQVANKRLTTIVITRHREGKGESAEKITADIIAAQSLDVDVISGATISSRTILEAVERALKKSEE
jgi:uncharacterized protein with FMN-binding domain